MRRFLLASAVIVLSANVAPAFWSGHVPFPIGPRAQRQGGGIPGTCSTSLIFSQACNSQYLALGGII